MRSSFCHRFRILLSSLAVSLYLEGPAAARTPETKQDALAITETTVGPDHRLVENIEEHLGLLLLRQGRLDQALTHYRRGLHIFERHVRTSPNEGYAASLLSRHRRTYEAITGLTLRWPQSQAAVALALQATLLFKSRSMEVGRLAGQMRKQWQQSPRYAQLQAALHERARLLDQSYLRAETGDPVRIKQLLATAQQIEQELVREVGSGTHRELPGPDRIIESVAARLAPGSVLIEIVHGRAPEPGVGELRVAEPRYIGLLLFPDREMAAVDLGPAETERGRLVDFLFSLEDRRADVDAKARAAYEQVFRPFEPLLRRHDVHRLIVAPDGLLQFIPIGALHDGSQYLSDRFTIQYVSSGRDLLLAPSPTAPRPALVLADPRAAGQRRLVSARRIGIAIARELSVAPLLDEEATELSLLKREAPYLMLLAAHGQFRDNLPRVKVPSYPAEGFAEPVLRGESRLPPDRWDATTAMHRSALALTPGRVATKDTWQDGWLTGEEAIDLRLVGTQLVTLLACEGGRGAISSGQGIYGLRRAFLQAGAETVVSALWSVEEQSASELVHRYLSKLLKQNKGRVEAMEEAMHELRSQPAYRHPYYWAPFIVMGMDGPLRPPVRLPVIHRAPDSVR